jgi:hypothetical protein
MRGRNDAKTTQKQRKTAAQAPHNHTAQTPQNRR